MSGSNQQHRPLWRFLIGLAIVACFAVTGCQVQTGGQTLPNGNYMSDDVQYYAPGPEFKLANEAAAMKANRAETIAAPQAQP
ncbi:MAG: hypothetical protein JW888_11740 [Pirellulales bacterium]|nr:hypothetical protein [Pirellulales bacterium]